MTFMPKMIHLSAASALVLAAMPATAAAPTFDTPAPVAYMVDLSSDAVLYAKDIDHRMPPASLAKMMTVYVVFDMLKKGQLKADQQFTMSPETWKKWHSQGSTMFLKADESVSVDNLLKGIVTLSGNDACVVLAEGVSGTEPAFTDRMNEAAKKLGLTNSHFGTSNGWPDNGVTYVTARDLAKLAEATIRDFPDLYKRYYALPNFTWGTQMNGSAIDQANRDPLLGVVAGADGLKTGHTEEAGYGFTGSANRDGRRIVMVVAGLNSFNQRIEESVRFMEWGFSAWQSRPLLRQGQHIGEAQVQGASVSSVGLAAQQPIAVTYPAGLGQHIRARIVYNGPVRAPIAQGQHIADLVVETGDGTPPQVMPLAAESAVSEAGFFGRMWYGLKSLFGAA